MAYETNPNPMAANDPMAGGGGESGEMGETHISSDQLPADIKEGDMLVCTGMDESGCTFKLEKGKGGGGMSWEDEARETLSPRKGGEEAA